MKKTSLLLALALTFGCATGSKVMLGSKHPPISADAVKVYDEKPANAETIAVITADNILLYRQAGANSCLAKLKHDAAKLGANGIVIDRAHNSAWDGSEITAKAIYVP